MPEQLGIYQFYKRDISRMCNISKMILEGSVINFEEKYLPNNYIA